MESTADITMASNLNVGTLLYTGGNCINVDYDVFDNQEFDKIILFVSVNAKDQFTLHELLLINF